MTDITRSNSLADLAARINAEHEAVILAMGRGLNHAINCGLLLIEAKAQLEHGQWLPWLRDHCPESLPERTASHYMRLARHAPELEAKSATVADLGVRDALRLLAPPRGTTGTGDNEWYTPVPQYIEAYQSTVASGSLAKSFDPCCQCGCQQGHYQYCRCARFLWLPGSTGARASSDYPHAVRGVVQPGRAR